ncbi:Protein of unknown function [Tessaracoccus bendigoensis DSM 12906]|uniref:DUF3224 domain-containing protein n=1 Tax=Tessaracoccus bendigoensis DSM 12906 TaxID=1123357 RepID=A0A1M6K9R8_9ACTN|nr:DUF3224 domain-containing protein [Tessaracoccus bendigoensis]SHJ55597.1 Protein of unknown function [Tessaracoccus bendigoensis DSM 12906]
MAIRATFEIEITPTEAVLPATGRFDFAKVWTGDIRGVSRGVMLSAGDPASGTAGYVALEVFEGTIGERSGTVAFQQLGTMDHGNQGLRYLVVPGSGTGDLVGAIGVLNLKVDSDSGIHSVVLELSSDR